MYLLLFFRSESFGARSYSIATLMSIFFATPGTMDMDKQKATTPVQTDIAPIPRGIDNAIWWSLIIIIIQHCFYCSILVSRTLSVDEVFPADSPFLRDQNDLNITNVELRNSVFSVGVGQCSLVSNNVQHV